MIWIVCSVLLAGIAASALLRLQSVRKAMRDMASSLHESLHTDTNALITTVSSDAAVCELADALNRELKVLRREHLRIENGTHELQTAVTNIAHDLRTPLTAISGYLELMEQEEHSGPSAGYLAVIRERTDALKALTEELFRYSVADTAPEELKTEELSLRAELEIALASAYQTLSERGIEPAILLTEDAVERRSNRAALQRIFGNVLNNAAKYSAGDLTVELRADGTVIFSNTAPGLSEVEVGKMFERFYTVENAKNSTGLGLSIAKLLTERLGGSIDARLEGDILSIRLCF